MNTVQFIQLVRDGKRSLLTSHLSSVTHLLFVIVTVTVVENTKPTNMEPGSLFPFCIAIVEDSFKRLDSGALRDEGPDLR